MRRLYWGAWRLAFRTYASMASALNHKKGTNANALFYFIIISIIFNILKMIYLFKKLVVKPIVRLLIYKSLL